MSPPKQREARAFGNAGSRRLEPLLVLLFTLGMIAANALPNALRLRGETTGSVSAKVPTLFTPAGYAFSIWSLIYLGLLSFAVYQWLPAQRCLRPLADIRRPYLVSCLLNSAWIFIWHYELIGLSAVVIATLLVSLLVCYVRLDRDRGSESVPIRWLVLAPLSLYTAWVTVATIVNVAVTLVAYGWQGGPLAPASWSVVLTIAAFALALLVAWPRRDWVFLAVVAWATGAIAVAQSAYPSIRWTAQTAAGLLLVAAAILVVRRGRKGRRAARPSPMDRSAG